MALDSRDDSLHRTRARAVGFGVIDKCVVARGAVVELSAGCISFAGARQAWHSYKAGAFPSSETLDPETGGGVGALPLSRVQAACKTLRESALRGFHTTQRNAALQNTHQTDASASRAGGQAGQRGGHAGRFDLAVDNGAILDTDPSLRPKAVQAVHSILRPGGLYFVLWPASSPPPSDAPPPLAPTIPAAVKRLFDSLFDLEQAVATRFDDQTTSSLDLPPPAIALLFRAMVVVNVKGCSSVVQAWQLLLAALKAPPSHPLSFDALARSLIEARALGVERPTTVLLQGVAGSQEGVKAWCQRLVDLTLQLRHSWSKDGKEVRILMDSDVQTWKAEQLR